MKKITAFQTPILLTVILSVFISCSKDQDEDSTNDLPSNFKYLDISDAKSLIIASEATNATTKSAHVYQDQENRILLYKLTENGALVEVSYRDENGHLINNEYHLKPLDIKKLNDNYVLLCFHSEIYDPSLPEFPKFLVRKSDGAVFIAPTGCNYENADNYYSPDDFNIGDNNFYYINVKAMDGMRLNTLCKLLIDDNGNISQTQISIDKEGLRYYQPPGIQVSNPDKFFVDSDQNYIYYLEGGGEYRIISKSGSISSANNINPQITGPDGSIYSFEDDHVYKLVIDERARITKVLHGSFMERFDFPLDPMPEITYHKFGERILLFHFGKVADIFEGNGTITVHNPVEGLISDGKLMTSENYYFYAGYSGSALKIYRMGSSTHIPTELTVDFTPFEIKLENVVVLNDNEIVCSGLRRSDAAWVNFKANFNGNNELLDVIEREIEIIQLERIQ